MKELVICHAPVSLVSHEFRCQQAVYGEFSQPLMLPSILELGCTRMTISICVPLFKQAMAITLHFRLYSSPVASFGVKKIKNWQLFTRKLYL